MAISRILVPTDFSVHANAAFDYALELARTVNANISLLHVVDNLLQGGMWSDLIWSDEIDTADLAELQVKLVRDAEARLTHSVPRDAERVSTEVRRGDPTKEILEAARHHGADLIIMGTHVVMGRVAEDVLRQAPCPVLMVRAATVSNVAQVA